MIPDPANRADTGFLYDLLRVASIAGEPVGQPVRVVEVWQHDFLETRVILRGADGVRHGASRGDGRTSPVEALAKAEVIHLRSPDGSHCTSAPFMIRMQ